MLYHSYLVVVYSKSKSVPTNELNYPNILSKRWNDFMTKLNKMIDSGGCITTFNNKAIVEVLYNQQPTSAPTQNAHTHPPTNNRTHTTKWQLKVSRMLTKMGNKCVM